MAAERVQCVAKTAFYEAVDVLRSQQKTKQPQITLFVEDKFYDKAKQYLKSIIEDDFNRRPSSRRLHNVSAIDLGSNNNNPKEMEVQ